MAGTATERRADRARVLRRKQWTSPSRWLLAAGQDGLGGLLCGHVAVLSAASYGAQHDRGSILPVVDRFARNELPRLARQSHLPP